MSHFWSKNHTLLQDAWAAWEQAERSRLPVLDEHLLDARLRNAVDAAWRDPSAEDAVRTLWDEVAPGVLQCQFFDPDRLADLRAYVDAAFDADIPVRAPYGIVLNRRGVMLDPRSAGYLAGPSFQAFYRVLVDRYFRPISRLLFPETTGCDGQSFGFSIEYQAGMDTAIRPHTDASSTTLNLNVNLPGEGFSGSEVEFFDPVHRGRHTVVFKPGVAVLHRGTIPHAARPITTGLRTNLVMWLYGQRGQVRPSGAPTGASAAQRWTVPTEAPDGFAPF